MLHKNKSTKAAILKYGLSAPLFAGMIIFSSATIEPENLQSIDDIKTKIKRSDLPAVFKAEAQMIKDKSMPQKFEAKFSESLKPAPEVKSDSSAKINKRKSFQETIIVGDTIKDPVYGYGTVDIMPEYPGGMNKFYEYVGKTYRYPKEAKDAGVKGRIILQFNVEKDGSLSDIKTLRDLGMGTGEEAVRIMHGSAKWNPGIQNGKPVRVAYTLPIVLNLESQQGGIQLKSNFDSKNAYILLNGKHISSDELKKIDPKTIESIDVIKDKAKYADHNAPADAEGVIIIKLK